MEIKRMSAVAYIEQTAKNLLNNGADFGKDFSLLLANIERAKEMEENQIVGAYYDGQHFEASFSKHADIVEPTLDAQNYYDSFYKQD